MPMMTIMTAAATTGLLIGSAATWAAYNFRPQRTGGGGKPLSRVRHIAGSALQAPFKTVSALTRQRSRTTAHVSGYRHSGRNDAFESYRTETINRLEQEADAFHDFLEQLRHSNDKAEFDAFISDRRIAKQSQSLATAS